MSKQRLFLWFVSIVLTALAAAACVAESDGGPELNPQPLPPGTEDPNAPGRGGPATGATGGSEEGSAYDSANGKGSSGGSSSGTGGGSGAPPPSPQGDKDAGATSWQPYQLVPKL